MKRFGIIACLLLCTTWFMTGCNKKKEAQLEETFLLKYRHTATIGKEIEIKFAEVSDSRCPTDVECIIPGDLEIGLKINGEKFDLLLGSYHHSKVTKDGFEIELKDATPTTFTSTERPRKKDYTISLIVRKT